MHRYRAFLLVGLILLTEGSMAASALPSPKAHPRTFCDFAAEMGYPTRGFNEDAGICSSNMTDVATTPGKNGLRNNLAFYSMAEDDSVAKLHRVSLILNINNTSEKAPAYAEFVRFASSIAAKIVGQPPAGFAQVIASAGTKMWKAGEWTVEVRSKQWPTGLRQDTVVYFRPTAAQ